MRAKRIPFFICFASLLFCIINIVFSDEFKPYQSLLPEGSSEPFGHLIVQVPENRKAPEDWEMQWWVSTYTPKGFRLPLGVINDEEPLTSERRLVFKVPVGKYKIEITKRSNELNRTVFNIDEGVYQYNRPSAEFVSSIQISVKENDIKVVNINYQNPQRLESTEKKEEVKILYLWENFSLGISDGNPEDIPEGKLEIYHVVKYAPFNEIEEIHLVEALKDDAYWDAAGALLHLENPNTGLIVSALKDKSLEFNWSVAEILAKGGGRDAVLPLIDIFINGPEKNRYLVAWTLGELEDKEATPLLIKALKDKSVIMKNHAAYALSKIKDESALDALIEATQDQTCLKGQILSLKNPELFLTIFLDEEYKMVGMEVPIPTYCVHHNAIHALGQIKSEKSSNHLLNLLHHTDIDIQRQAIYALINQKNERVVDALIEKITSGNQSIRWLAIQVLGTFRDKKALDPLSELEKTETDKMVLEAIREAINKIKSPEPVKKKEVKKPDIASKEKAERSESKGIDFPLIVIIVLSAFLIIILAFLLMKKKAKAE